MTCKYPASMSASLSPMSLTVFGGEGCVILCDTEAQLTIKIISGHHTE